MTWRARFERHSTAPLTRLAVARHWAIVIAVAAVFAVGLSVHGALSGLLLLLVAAGVGWLGVLSWPALGLGGRSLRVLVVSGLVLLAASRL